MKAFLPLALLAVLLGAGCATQNVNTVSRANEQAAPNFIADKRVVTDASLAGKVRILAVNEGKVSGDHLKIQVRIENNKSKTVMFRYRVEWVDANGMMLPTPTDLWKPFTLQGREQSVIEAVAVSPKAVDFVLKIQET
ncbi:DUF1425 domain-containing protein [Nibricoccus sp. IMCC34717]|uniref:DUF1425 domain-containing protein n=1 Tax=Nibricoccus sp. IMCC34717 TaxID=3034021 RepID=UPI00384FB3BE